MKKISTVLAFHLAFTAAILAQSAADSAGKGVWDAHTISNPVLPGVADAGVIRYRGEYYTGGVNTLGSFYQSGDLVHWKGPFHVLTMNNEWATPYGIGNEQIHSDDINYINGVFHLYWNVNYWSKDRNVIHIGHATAADIHGPFTEPLKSTWFDSRLDPKLFVDDDGRMYFYSVKFTDGNTIWGQPMKDAGTLTGKPRYMFASLPGTWETIDNRVEEGPWVFKYRSRYYMMFNCNHTATEWGNYALGVAEAAGPMEFNLGGKYPYPVVQSNQLDMEDKYADLLKYTGGDSLLYTVIRPDSGWNKTGFGDVGWSKGKGGFGSNRILHSTTRQVNTDWKEPEIWIRKKFVMFYQARDHFALRIHHDGDTKVFLNGVLIYDGWGRDYRMKELGADAMGILQNGENTLAVYSAKGRRSNFVDLSLFDLKDAHADDILMTPGQSSILRGPNGFEWWLVYMANKNDGRRGQCIDRVHFFDKRLVVDGMTGLHTCGYHPAPARSEFGALFNDSAVSPTDTWELRRGHWEIADHALMLVSARVGGAAGDVGAAFPKTRAAINYLFEVSVKVAGGRPAGVYAWMKDAGNWVRIGIDPKMRSWLYTACMDGKLTTRGFELPVNFNYGVYHKITFYKNEDRITVNLDELPAPGRAVIYTDIRVKGVPGLFAEGAGTSFDGVTYTIGWDEFDETVRGWNAISGRAGMIKGAWTVTGKGLESPVEKGGAMAVKGDLLDSYEFGAQVSVGHAQEGKLTTGAAGIMPVYVDGKNYLKAGFDYDRQRFIVTGMRYGQSVQMKEADVSGWQPYYTDMTKSDGMERHFTLHTGALADGIRISKSALRGGDPLHRDLQGNIQHHFEDLPVGFLEKLVISYKHNGQWDTLSDSRIVNDDHPGFVRIVFDPIETDEIKIENRGADSSAGSIYKIWVNERSQQSYQVRVVRRNGELFFFVDNEQVLRMKDDFPAARVGVYSSGSQAAFNGIMLFHLPME